MVSIGAETNELEPSRTFRSDLPTGAILDSSDGHSIPQAGSTDPADIVMMDAVLLEDAIRSRRVSCVEVMNAYLDHIENLNPKVNAIVALQDRPGLLAQALERDAQLARGESMGPLHGFPHAVKDLQPVKGIRSTSGSPILKDFVPTADSLMVERLRKAGAIIVGKTNTPEFGLGSHTYNPVYGATRNAYDQSRSAGGSSGGAAVALALRMLPVAEACAIRLAGTMFWVSVRAMAGFQGMRATSGCRR
jgi:amidase